MWENIIEGLHTKKENAKGAIAKAKHGKINKILEPLKEEREKASCKLLSKFTIIINTSF